MALLVGWVGCLFGVFLFMEDWDILLVLEVLDDRVLVYRHFQCLSSASRDGYQYIQSCGTGVDLLATRVEEGSSNNDTKKNWALYFVSRDGENVS